MYNCKYNSYTNSYTKFKKLCSPLTQAITSNRKFLPINDPLYIQPYTYMFRYPGQKSPFHQPVSSLNEDDVKHIHHQPEVIKTYYGKTYDKIEKEDFSCANCKK